MKKRVNDTDNFDDDDDDYDDDDDDHRTTKRKLTTRNTTNVKSDKVKRANPYVLLDVCLCVETKIDGEIVSQEKEIEIERERKSKNRKNKSVK